jgi:hypothetical protein
LILFMIGVKQVVDVHGRSLLVAGSALTYRRDGESVGRRLKFFFVSAPMDLTYRVAAGCVGSDRKKSWPLLADYSAKLAHDLWNRFISYKFGRNRQGSFDFARIPFVYLRSF